MLPGWVIFTTAFGYVLLLFAVASYGDRRSRLVGVPKGGRPVVIVNRGVTRGDELATLKIDGGCSETLAALAG